MLDSPSKSDAFFLLISLARREVGLVVKMVRQAYHILPRRLCTYGVPAAASDCGVRGGK